MPPRYFPGKKRRSRLNQAANDPPAPKPTPSSRSSSPEPVRTASATVDEFYPSWDSFLAKASVRATRLSTLASKVEEVKAAVKADGGGLPVHESVATSYEQAAEECRKKVAAIKEECIRLNRKHKDLLFDLDILDDDTVRTLSDVAHGRQGHGPPRGIKRVPDIFDAPAFFSDGVSAEDVQQGYEGGNCWFLAALMSVSAKPDLITRLCVARDEKCGVYGFVFYRDGEWIHTVIDDRLYICVGDSDDVRVGRLLSSSSDDDTDKSKRTWVPVLVRQDREKIRETLQKGSPALFYASCKGNGTWLPLIEKAYAKVHGDYRAMDGGWASEGIEELTGGVAEILHAEDIMDKDRFWADLLKVNETFLFGGSARGPDKHGIVSSHAYSILRTWEEGSLRLLKIKNPWGRSEWDGVWSDGHEKWTLEMMHKLKHKFGDDGVFWMTYEDFLKHYTHIYRTRLFGPEWTVTQRWTSSNIPWTPEYLERYFQVTISQKSPVVLVLCQPDRRYFVGLQGRYSYTLHFRVCPKDGSKDHLIQGMQSSGDDHGYTRSVSAEIELEAGAYDVFIKVTPHRMKYERTAKETIESNVEFRKKKLLAVGRNFDMAMSKGKLREREEENSRHEQRQDRQKMKELARKQRRHRKANKERAAKRQARIEAAKTNRNDEPKPVPNENEQTPQPADTNSSQSPAAVTDSAEPQPAAEKTSTALISQFLLQQIVSMDELSQPDLEAARSLLEHLTVGSPSTTLADEKTEHIPAPTSREQTECPTSEPVDSPTSAVAGVADTVQDQDTKQLRVLEDDDFDWDSAIDGSVSDSEDGEREVEDLHKGDSWDAICVLGLRVYSLDKGVEIKVVEG